MKAKNVRTLGFLNLLGVIATLVVNYLSMALPLNGKTPGEISDMYPNLFVPAGLTFSIWGIIYLLLIAFGVYQLVQSYRQQSGIILFHERVGVWFLIVCGLNVAWLFAWHYLFMATSALIMLLLLASLIVMYLKLRIGKENSGLIEGLFLKLPFSIYLGWSALRPSRISPRSW
jgi:hypothetical protein